MDGRSADRARALALGLACSLLACSEEPRPAPGWEVQLTTNFGTDQLNVIAVESLNDQGDVVTSAGWFEVGTGDACTPSAQGERFLGSFGVAATQSSFTRVRLTGYRRNPDGTLAPIVQRSLVPRADQMTAPLGIQLVSACAEKFACASNETCDPASGVCVPIENVGNPPASKSGAGCLVNLGPQPPGPVVPPPAPAPPETPVTPTCLPGDGMCGAGCDWTRDSDCRLAIGKPCDLANPPPCVENAECVDGFCCGARCAGECERCDLPTKLGQCTHLPYSEFEGPASAPNAKEACTSDHVSVTCVDRKCAPDCEAGFADCSAEIGQQGSCETKLGDEKNCRKCGETCRYGYCSPAEGCTRAVTSTSETFGVMTSGAAQPGLIYATALPIPVDHKKLRALGILVDGRNASGKIKIALYFRRGTSLDLFASTTGDLDPVDNVQSDVEVAPALIRVEQAVATKDLPSDGAFTIAFQVSSATQLWTQPSPLFWRTAMSEWKDFPASFPPEADLMPLPTFQPYAVTTPN